MRRPSAAARFQHKTAAHRPVHCNPGWATRRPVYRLHERQVPAAGRLATPGAIRRSVLGSRPPHQSRLKLEAIPGGTPASPRNGSSNASPRDGRPHTPAQSARHLVSGRDRGATNRGRERSDLSTIRCGPGSLHGFSSRRRRRPSSPSLWIQHALRGLKTSELQERAQGLRPEAVRHGRLPGLRIPRARLLFAKRGSYRLKLVRIANTTAETPRADCQRLPLSTRGRARGIHMNLMIPCRLVHDFQDP
jgi:hypothetical protein